MDAGTLTPREKVAAWLCAGFAALLRWPALSKTLWDWDEALFALRCAITTSSRITRIRPAFRCSSAWRR
jgi:hypothetical protein